MGSTYIYGAINDSKLIAVTSFTRHTPHKEKPYYSIGLSVVRPEYKLKNVYHNLIVRLFIIIFFSALKHKDGHVEILFITNNVYLIRQIEKISLLIYPNINQVNLETKRVPKADDITWARSNEYLYSIGERHFRLQREGCVISKSYDDMPELFVYPAYSKDDKKAKLFAEHYLITNNGNLANEVVVRSILSMRLLSKYISKFIWASLQKK
jgi:hypothetical protein